VLGLDGSAEADRAFEYARRVAIAESAHVDVVHVREYMIAGRAGMQTAKADEADLEAAVRLQVEELQRDGVDVHMTVVSTTTGGPAHALADHARASGADVIIVGTRGHTKLAGLLLGSVTQRLMHVSPCPVLAIPSGATTTEIPDESAATATTS